MVRQLVHVLQACPGRSGAGGGRYRVRKRRDFPLRAASYHRAYPPWVSAERLAIARSRPGIEARRTLPHRGVVDGSLLSADLPCPDAAVRELRLLSHGGSGILGRVPAVPAVSARDQPGGSGLDRDGGDGQPCAPPHCRGRAGGHEPRGARVAARRREPAFAASVPAARRSLARRRPASAAGLSRQAIDHRFRPAPVPGRARSGVRQHPALQCGDEEDVRAPSARLAGFGRVDGVRAHVAATVPASVRLARGPGIPHAARDPGCRVGRQRGLPSDDQPGRRPGSRGDPRDPRGLSPGNDHRRSLARAGRHCCAVAPPVRPRGRPGAHRRAPGP